MSVNSQTYVLTLALKSRTAAISLDANLSGDKHVVFIMNTVDLCALSFFNMQRWENHHCTTQTVHIQLNLLKGVKLHLKLARISAKQPHLKLDNDDFFQFMHLFFKVVEFPRLIEEQVIRLNDFNDHRDLQNKQVCVYRGNILTKCLYWKQRRSTKINTFFCLLGLNCLTVMGFY